MHSTSQLGPIEQLVNSNRTAGHEWQRRYLAPIGLLLGLRSWATGLRMCAAQLAHSGLLVLNSVVVW